MKTPCPVCQAPLQLPEGAVGKTFGCPRCSARVRIGLSDDGRVAASSSEPTKTPRRTKELKTTGTSPITPASAPVIVSEIEAPQRSRRDMIVWSALLALPVVAILGAVAFVVTDARRRVDVASGPSVSVPNSATKETKVPFPADVNKQPKKEDASVPSIPPVPPTPPTPLIPPTQLAEEMESAGYSVVDRGIDIWSLEEFVRFGTKQIAATSQKGDQFDRLDAEKAGKKHRETLRKKRFQLKHIRYTTVDRDDLETKGLFLNVRLPLRVWFDRPDKAKDDPFRGILSHIHVADVECNEYAFLTKDKTLRNCTAIEAATVIENRGVIYHPERPWTELLLVFVAEDDELKDVARNPAQHTVEIDIENLEYVRPSTWGFFRRDGLVSNDWDCARIRRFFHVGLDKAERPNYFVTQTGSGAESSKTPELVQARLTSLKVFRNDGTEVGAYSSSGANSAKGQSDAKPVQMTKLLQNESGNEITSKTTGMKLALIPAGTFTMGSPAGEADRQPDEGPQHMVHISQPFYMGVYEVTQGEFQKVLGRNTSWFSKTGSGSSSVSGKDSTQFPVDRVTWYDAIEFCNKLSQADGLTMYYALAGISRRADQSIQSASVTVVQGDGYRLPMEAEWEYACRTNTTTPFHFGSVLNGDKANVNGASPYGTTTKGVFLHRTTTVGSYSKNEFGLFDMHGNVWEWCDDVYDESLYGKRSGTTTDPKVTSGSEDRVLRGGSWGDYSKDARSAVRGRPSPINRLNGVGFRVVLSSSAVRTPLTPPPKKPSPRGTTAGERRVLTMEGVEFAFRWIPPTTALPVKFNMGTPTGESGRKENETQVDVVLDKGYWMLETEITQAMYFAVMKAQPWQGKNYVKNGATYPAVHVSHQDATDCCAKLTTAARKAGVLSANEQIALPTEAQWEWAARAGTTTAYVSGQDDSILGDFAWYAKNAWDIGEKYAHEVGKKKPNPWGLHDITGNTGEWCSDWYADKLPGGTNPPGSVAGSSRVLRGGCFNNGTVGSRVGFRVDARPANVGSFIGFRVIISLE